MFRKYSSYILCFLISLLVVALYINDFSPLVRLEWKIQDMLYSFRGEENYSSEIVLVGIDDSTVKEFGDWPWHRDRIADLLAAVGSGEPRTVLLDMLFDASVSEDTSGYTEILAGQLSWITNVILPYEFSPGEFMGSRISTPKYLYNSSMQVNSELGVLDERSSLLAHKLFLPPELLCEYAEELGFKYNIFDRDRKIRWAPLVMHYEGYYYPSAALITAANYLGLTSSAITVHGGNCIRMGSVEIPTNESGQLFINYNKPNRSFTTVSAADILNEKYDPANFRDKLVIISVTSDFVTDFYRTPVSDHLESVELTANVIENIIHSNFIKRLDSSPGRDMLFLIVLGGIFAFILPRVSLMYRLIILIASLFVFANVNFVLFNSYQILTRSLYLGLELFLLLLASPFLDNEFLSKLFSIRIGFGAETDASGLPKVEMPERGLRADEAGRRDFFKSTVETTSEIAREKPSQEKRHEELATVATDQRELGDSATRVDVAAGKDEKQAEVELQHATEHISEHAELPASKEDVLYQEPTPVSGVSADITNDSGSIENLGRYKVVGVLGKGAMGTVYKGIDPAIDRNVALKTIRLDFVNDEQEFEELKERLSREAKAAGMLSHPNIVTIYDVGTEGKLQYIAMEYLEGQTLEDMIRRKVKFNLRIIAEIITQICGALNYAHSQGIVHRDIKPANIMVLKDYRVKVMDFGIARVDSSSMTRTGIAMGTPNYISPEQLQGKQVDRRCDVFSLGVVIYEMLLHRRPFRAENLTSLIYSIVNSDVEPPSSIDKSIPLIFDRLIEKALKKNPADRFQQASEISAMLADLIDSFAPKRTSTV